MALSVSGDQVEAVLRDLLPRQGYALKNPPRRKGETGADILAEKDGRMAAIECIGFQDNPPLRSKQFYEVFFRAISRLDEGVAECVIALPARFAKGMNQRAKQYGSAWKRIAGAFPELRIWFVCIDKPEYEAHAWSDWPLAQAPSHKRRWNPGEGTIGHLVLKALQEDPNIAYDRLRGLVLQHDPQSKFNKHHFVWYKSRFRKEM